MRIGDFGSKVLIFEQGKKVKNSQFLTLEKEIK
jgi:hypothetical protein